MKIATEEKDQLRYFDDMVRGLEGRGRCGGGEGRGRRKEGVGGMCVGEKWGWRGCACMVRC